MEVKFLWKLLLFDYWIGNTLPVWKASVVSELLHKLFRSFITTCCIPSTFHVYTTGYILLLFDSVRSPCCLFKYPLENLLKCPITNHMIWLGVVCKLQRCSVLCNFLLLNLGSLLLLFSWCTNSVSSKCNGLDHIATFLTSKGAKICVVSVTKIICIEYWK